MTRNANRMTASWQASAVYMMEDAGFDPVDEWQCRVLESTSKRILINCTRQGGKSEVTAFKALHHSQTVEDSLTLIVSRSDEQAQGLFRKITKAYDTLGQPVSQVRRLSDRISFANGGMIVALPNNSETARHWSAPSLIILDEASRVVPEMITAVWPMILASHGIIMMLSTPKGRSNFFGERWHDPYGSWDRITAKAADISRFDPAEVEEIRRELGERVASQELDCEFLYDEDQVFSISSIENAFISDVQAIPGF
jgi:hypothetical protein